MDIKKLREGIDRVDGQIIALLRERAQLARQVGEFKKAHSLPFHVVAREREILDRILEQKTDPFPKEALRHIYREILSACLSLEEPVTVSYLGPPATYTHQAAIKQFGNSLRFLPAATIRDVFRFVESGDALYGIVPIENSTEGMVNYTLDTLVETDLKVVGEIVLPIHHCLLTRAQGLASVKTVYAHPQSQAQCRSFLSANLPNVPLVETSSNARAVELCLEDEASAAIAGEMASDVYNIPILRRHIEDFPDNQTRFLVIGTIEPGKTRRDQTSIMISIIDRVGALSSILDMIARQGINVTRLESRPSRKKAWDYIFFIDIEGHQQDTSIRELLKKLQTLCPYVKILGSYPVPDRKTAGEVSPGFTRQGD
ncbi:MAG: prephenate dehydratase [Leptospirillum sp.]